MSINQLGDLRVLIDVVRTGSFSAAARQLGLPPSSVSRCIAAMEDRLGIILFTRTTRRVALTDAGRSYSDAIRRILAELDEADRVVASLRETPHGLLRIESRVGLGSRFIAPLLPRFLQQHEGLRIDLRLTTSPLDTLGPGTDLAVRFGLGQPSSLVTRRIGSPQQRLWATPGYLAKHGEPRSPEELAHHNCLAFVQEGGQAQWRFRKGATEQVIRPHGTLGSNDFAAVSAALVRSLGIAVSHDWFIAAEARAGRLVQLLPEWEVTTMQSFDTQIYILYAAHAQETPNARVFTTYLTRCFADASGPDDEKLLLT